METGIFKAYDIRGKYPNEINKKTVLETGKALGGFFGPKSKLVVSYDSRVSSPSLCESLVEGLKKSNSKLNIVRGGLATTPMFYFLVNYFLADGGIMVTASHNPKSYNGLKIVGKKAVPISGKEIYKEIKFNF